MKVVRDFFPAIDGKLIHSWRLIWENKKEKKMCKALRKHVAINNGSLKACYADTDRDAKDNVHSLRIWCHETRSNIDF